MKKIVKITSDEQRYAVREETYVCSKCGTVIVGPIQMDSDECAEIDWRDAPRKCVCGEQITETKTVIRTEPIIDEFVIEKEDGSIDHKKSELQSCHDCGVRPGQVHEDGCDVERCSVCGGQRLQCGCEGHDKLFAKWTGIWPGRAEADYLGVDLNAFESEYSYLFFIKGVEPE